MAINYNPNHPKVSTLKGLDTIKYVLATKPGNPDVIPVLVDIREIVGSGISSSGTDLMKWNEIKKFLVDNKEQYKGSSGSKGSDGAQGIQGPQGVAGQDGVQGPKGKSADPSSVNSEVIQGPMGPQGPQGIQGPKGPTGDPGVNGSTVNEVIPLTWDLLVETFKVYGITVSSTMSRGKRVFTKLIFDSDPTEFFSFIEVRRKAVKS